MRLKVSNMGGGKTSDITSKLEISKLNYKKALLTPLTPEPSAKLDEQLGRTRAQTKKLLLHKDKEPTTRELLLKPVTNY